MIPGLAHTERNVIHELDLQRDGTVDESATEPVLAKDDLQAPTLGGGGSQQCVEAAIPRDPEVSE